MNDEDLIEHLLNFGLTSASEKYGMDKNTIMEKLKLHMPHMFRYCECREGRGSFCMVACCDAYGLSFDYSQILK